MGELARGYSWAPAQPGNELALKHGAYSPRRFEPLAAELVEGVLEAAGQTGSATSFLADPSYRPAVWAWARTEARIQLLYEWLLDRGAEVNDAGEVLGAAALVTRLEARAESLRGRLGLDPLSRARLGRDIAAGQVDMAKLMAAAAAALHAQGETDGDAS